MSVVYSWWDKPVSEFSIAGQRDAMYVEAAFSTNPTHEPVEIVVDRKLAPEPDTSELAMEPAPHPDFDPAESLFARAADSSPSLALSRQQTVMDLKRPPDIETPPFTEYFASVSLLRRRSVEVANAEIEPPATPARLPRNVMEVPSPQPLIAVEQVAGVIDNTPPDLSGNRPPSYPAEAIRRRFEGTVLLRLYIAATGQVVRVDVVQSSGHSVLDEAAIKAVQSWRGRPANRSGKPVPTQELLPVRFRF